MSRKKSLDMDNKQPVTLENKRFHYQDKSGTFALSGFSGLDMLRIQEPFAEILFLKIALQMKKS